MKIELLIEKYLGLFGSAGAIYVNPSAADIKNLKSEGIRDVRWIIQKSEKKLYMWDANGQIHARVQNMLIDKGELDSDTERLNVCQYDHPDWICGHGRLGVGKIEFTSKEHGSYGNRDDEIKGEFQKYFYKASMK